MKRVQNIWRKRKGSPFIYQMRTSLVLLSGYSFQLPSGQADSRTSPSPKACSGLSNQYTNLVVADDGTIPVA